MKKLVLLMVISMFFIGCNKRVETKTCKKEDCCEKKSDLSDVKPDYSLFR